MRNKIMPKKVGSQFEGAHVLIADDVEFNREILTEMLDLMQIDSESVTDGTEVLEKVKDTNYDLIFMDIKMTYKDGYETTKEIRAMPIAQPKIIAMTASAMTGDREICFASGMDDYVNKPVQLGDLEKVLIK